MRVTKNQVTLLSAAVAALFSVGAHAQTQTVLASSNPTIEATASAVFAAEFANNTVLGTSGFAVNSILGIGTSANQQRYVKYTLTNATFTSNLGNTAVSNISMGVVGANTTNTITPTVAFGGASGTSSVIYQITTPNGANINDGISFNIPGGINVTAAGTTATVTYEVYEFLSDALNAPDRRLYRATGNLARFATSFAFNNAGTSRPTQTATSISGFRRFNNGATGSSATAANVAVIGNLSIALGSTITRLANGTTAVALNDLFATTNSQITVTGDFSAAASNSAVTLAGVGSNSTGFVGTATGAAVFNINATSFTANTVAFTVNGSTPVAAGSYNASFVSNPASGFRSVTASLSGIGTITRDSVTYESPWATATPGFLSRYFLTHTAGSTVTWSAVVRNPSGTVNGGTLSGTIESGKVTQIPLASLLPADLTNISGPFQVTFTLAADASQAQGSYVLTTPSGSVTSVPLYRADRR
jgi:hypothetical protein